MPNEQTRTGRQAIKVWLAERDKTQRWLAAKAKVSEPLLSSILSGHVVPSEDVRHRLAKVTGIDLASFARVA